MLLELRMSLAVVQRLCLFGALSLVLLDYLVWVSIIRFIGDELEQAIRIAGAVSHVSMGAEIFPVPMAVVVTSCLIGAVVSARFANKCEIKKLNHVVGVVLTIWGIDTIAIKLL